MPLDGSELAETALPAAVELQQKLGATMVLLRAIDPHGSTLIPRPAFFESPASAAASVEMMQQIVAEERQEAQAYLHTIGGKFPDTRLETAIIEDSPPDAIVKLASERPGSLIVMSSHGHGGVLRLVFGSVTDAVLKASPTPVLLVRHSDDS